MNMNGMFESLFRSQGRFHAIGFIAATVVAVFMMTGCTTLGPNYKRPAADVESEWRDYHDPGISSISPSDPQWWTRAFRDPMLDELIEMAIQENLSLRSAGLRVLEAQMNLAIAMGQRYPQTQEISGSVAGIRGEKPGGQVGGYGVIDVGFNMAWEADVWGRFRRLVESASAQLDASVANYDDVMVSLQAQVAQNYLVIRTYQARLKVALENVQIQKKSLAIVESKFEGGMVTELDVDQAKTLLNNTQAEVGLLETTLQQTKNSLAVLLGKPPQKMGSLLAKYKPIPQPPVKVAIGMPQNLIRQRPDIRIAERNMAAQSAQIGYAITELYPSFGLGGTISLGTTDLAGASKFFSSDSLTGNVGGGLQWSILNYGRLKNNVRLQDATFQQLLVDYQNTVLQAQAEVENAIVAYLKSKEQLRYYRLAADAAQRSVNISTVQYQDGTANYTSVIQTLNALRSQQDQLVSTQGEVATNLVQVYKSLGGGWRIRGTADPVDRISDSTRSEMLERTNYWKGVLE